MEKKSGKSCSEDWQLRSTDKSDSIGKIRKFRRLLKHGDLPRRKPPDELNTSTSRRGAALCGTSSHTGFKRRRAIGNLSVFLFIERNCILTANPSCLSMLECFNWQYTFHNLLKDLVFYVIWEVSLSWWKKGYWCICYCHQVRNDSQTLWQTSLRRKLSKFILRELENFMLPIIVGAT